MNERKLRLLVIVHSVDLVYKLRKFWHTELLSVGLVKVEIKEDIKNEAPKME
ncbi:hypothetical protein KSP40_PGU008766 [Platanthera guangdongensis]|uniref:Uncharacterized protein n=1 Tax=Platanthera guangdongensis TaxID=2320717 RepID=A0ABR2MNB8_9ASPA